MGVGTDGYMAPELLEIEDSMGEIDAHMNKFRKKNQSHRRDFDYKHREREYKKKLYEKYNIKGYGFPVDVYSAGVLFGQLLFSVLEEDITDLDNHSASGPGFVQQVEHMSPKERKTGPEGTEMGYDLMLLMLQNDPEKRITIEKALQHRYFRDESLPFLSPRLVP